MAIHVERPPANHALRRAVADRAAVRAPGVGPWTRRQCRLLAVVHAIALAVIVLSYRKTCFEAYPADQLRWLSLSVVAVLVTVAADWLFFTGGHRRASRVRRHLFTPAAVATAAVSSSLVAVAGTQRFHNEGCAFAAGKSAQAAERAEHLSAGRIPCEVCLPGGEG